MAKLVMKNRTYNFSFWDFILLVITSINLIYLRLQYLQDNIFTSDNFKLSYAFEPLQYLW